MVWFIVFTVLILAVFFAGFRKSALALVAVALALGVGLFLYNRQEEQNSLTRIPPSELVLENVTLNPYAGSYKIAGRMKNNSAKFGVKQIDLVVTVKDCIPKAAETQCVTIGESREILNINVPPGEARDFEESVRFSGNNPRLKGQLEWTYSVSRIRAE